MSTEKENATNYCNIPNQKQKNIDLLRAFYHMSRQNSHTETKPIKLISSHTNCLIAAKYTIHLVYTSTLRRQASSYCVSGSPIFAASTDRAAPLLCKKQKNYQSHDIFLFACMPHDATHSNFENADHHH